MRNIFYVFILLFFALALFAEPVKHDAFTVQYNEKNHCPDYVIYTLTEIDVLANHSRASFIKDPAIKETLSPMWYIFSGYERGHLCPAEAKGKESFYTSNISPMNPILNKGLWKEIENLERKTALRGEKLLIICGPVFYEKNDKWIKGMIRIPDAFYKIIFSGEIIRSYLIPNESLAGKNPDNYHRAVLDIEKVAGLKFEQIKALER